MGEEYLTATGSYHGYSTQYSTNTTIFDDGVDLKKIVGVLGVDERNQFRKQLCNLRQIVYGFFKGEYAFKYADDYVYNTPLKTLDGRYLFHQLAEVIIASPYQIDNHLQLPSHRIYDADDDIKKDFEKLFDKHKLPSSFKFREKTANPDAELESKHIIVALAAGKLNVKVEEGMSNALKEDVSIKLAGVTKSLIGVFADRAYTVLRNQNLTAKAFDTSNLLGVQKKIAEGINKGLLVNGDELFKVTSKGIIATFENQIYLLSTEGSSAFKLEMISNSPGNNEVTTIASQKLTQKKIANNNFNNKLAKVVDHNAFRGAFGLLALYNLKNSVDLLMANGSWRNRINMFGFAADVAQVASSFTEKILPKTILGTREGVVNFAKGFTKAAGAIGGVATGVVCIMDSKDLFNENDNDAGVALVGAGIGFAASGLAALIPSASALAAFAGPIGWGCLLAATALYFISEALKDDEFQKIYKHYLLSDYGECSKEGLTPMQYAQQILLKRAELTHPEYLETREDKSLPNLESPHNAYCILMEKTIMPFIKVKGIAKKVSNRSVFRGWYRKFQIQVPFYNYIHTEDDLKNIVVSAQFYPQHPQSYSSVRTDNVSINLKLSTGEQKGIVLIDVDIDRYTSNVGDGVFCNVYLQVMLPNGVENFFPFDTLDGKQRMLKVKTYLGYNTRGNEKIKGYYSIITQ